MAIGSSEARSFNNLESSMVVEKPEVAINGSFFVLIFYETLVINIS